MNSSKMISSIDLEGGDSQPLESPSKTGKNRQGRIDWDTYSHSGNKSSFAWLVFLFLALGLVVQQASLSTIAVRETTARSSLENHSFASPDLAKVATQRKLKEVSKEGKSEPAIDLESDNEPIEQ